MALDYSNAEQCCGVQSPEVSRFEYCVLSSGSKANCIYVSSGELRFLVDCGLSCKQTVDRLRSIKVEPESISAIIVTHEHIDHIAGIPTFCKKFNPSIILNKLTYANAPILETIPSHLLNFFSTGGDFKIGQVVVEPFSILHDAADPVGFRLSLGSLSIAIVTDLGQSTKLVESKIMNVQGLVLESNHDLNMLWDAPYPWEVKQRISGKLGHLSNEQASELVTKISEASRNLPLKHITAGHISEKSNCPRIVVDQLSSAWTGSSQSPTFYASSPYEPGPVLSVSA